MTSMEKHKTAQHNEHTSQNTFICPMDYMYIAILLNTSAFVSINIKTPYTQQRTVFLYIYISQTKQRYFKITHNHKSAKKRGRK